MEIVAGSKALGRELVRPVVTIGNFDGLHLGHRAILDTVIQRATIRKGTAVVYTFDPHPRKILHPSEAPGLLLTKEQKLELLEDAGVDVVVLEPFTQDFARTSPDVFVRECVHGSINPLEVYVGYDFHFGRDREGSMRLLTELGPRLGFAVTVVAEVTVGGRDVNSTRIRSLIVEGAVEEAGELLGRDYCIRGEVVQGDQRGRQLGFPTLNLAPDNEILPASGVYAGMLRFLDGGAPAENSIFTAVTNIGVRPTFGGEGGLVAEAHLLDFDADAYGRRVELSFVKRLRGEQRFPGPDALREQIGRDVEQARDLLGAR